MKKTFIHFIVLISPLLALGQDYVEIKEAKRNSIYVEAFGQGVFNSLSFDRLYRMDKPVKTSFTAGVTFIPRLSKTNSLVLGFPVSYNWLFGKKKHHLELGTGLTLWRETYHEPYPYSIITPVNNSYLYFTPKISYRFQKPDGGFFFRLSFTPVIPLIDREKFKNYPPRYDYLPYASGPFGDFIFPWPGLSIGWTLK